MAEGAEVQKKKVSGTLVALGDWHQVVKVEAAKRGISMKALVAEALEQYLQKRPE